MKVSRHIFTLAFVTFFLLSLFSSATYARESVIVSDYSNPIWESYIRQEIDEYNAVLPATAPQLIYAREEVKECSGTDRPVGFSVPTGIVLCHNPLAEHPARLYGLMRAFIFLPAETRTRPEDFLCHELMHAVTNIKDRPRDTPLRDDSCVWGLSPDLGAFDISYINETFAPPPAESKPKKHRKHKKNRQVSAVSSISQAAFM